MTVVSDVTALAGNLDLAQQAERPAFCPQRLTLTAAAPLNLNLIDESGFAHLIIVPAAGCVINRPIRTIVKAGSGAVQVIAEWWDPGTTYWNGTVP